MKYYTSKCYSKTCWRRDDSESGCNKYSTHAVDLCPVVQVTMTINCEACGAEIAFNDSIPMLGKRRCPSCTKNAARGMKC